MSGVEGLFDAAGNMLPIEYVLYKCDFTSAAERAFITTNEGLDFWVAFTLIAFEDLMTIRDNAPFTINAVKLRRLTILKFWIEDKIRMYEPPVATHFTQGTIITYNRLYETFIASRDRGAPILGPIFDEDDWE